MSRSFSPSNRAMKAAAAGALVAFAATLLALSLAPRASASFALGKCAGTNIQANGASFANTAHTWFKEQFKDFYCADTPFAGSLAPVLTYTGDGSGAGRQAMMKRDGLSRFGGSDEPPSAADVQKMNTGVGPTGNPAADPNPADNGQVHVIPAAIGVIAPLVNFPNACDVSDLNPESRTAEEFDGSSNPEQVARVRFTREEFAGIWAGAPGYENWDDVFPELECTDVPIIRVVRLDDSGSTYALKDYLNAIDPSRGWMSQYVAGANDTREWPNATFGSRTDCAGSPAGPGAGPASEQITSSCSTGGGAAADKLKATDGAVGYVDLATARGRGLAITPKGNDNDQYWTQLPDGGAAGGIFREPTVEPKGFRTDVTQKGANCASATFRNGTGGAALPSTLGTWASVTGVNSTAAFATCTLTYALVFDDNADVWGNSPAEEEKARTVKDYFQAAVSTSAQVGLLGRDYAPLPDEILTIARAGVASIDWNKGTGGGEAPPPSGGGTPPATQPITTPPPAVTPPSNAFLVTKKSIASKTGKATISLRLPGAGKVVLVGKAKVGKRTINVGRVTLNAGKAGSFNLTLNPSSAAKSVLKQRGSLKVNLEITFTPNGGSAKASKSALTLKLAKKG